jgi:hypothetical protein
VLLPLLVFYFIGLDWATNIVAPRGSWEVGPIENIQLILLLGIFVLSIIGLIRKKLVLEKVIFLFIGLLSLFVFFEELDYGYHYLVFFEQDGTTPFKEVFGTKNFHNRGNNARLFKRPIYPFMFLLFMVGPYYREKIKNQTLKYLIPAKPIIITAILTLVSYVAPRLLVDFNILEDGGMGVNIGEFSEIMVYYLFFLYLYEIIYERPSDQTYIIFKKPKNKLEYN